MKCIFTIGATRLGSLLALLCLASVQASAEGYTGPKDKLHVYLLTGGSVMSGEADMGAADAEVLERCYLLNAEGKWESAKGPLNRYSSIRNAKQLPKLGPGQSFVKAMLAANKDISIGLVVNAGESVECVTEKWGFKSELYRATRKRVTEARKTGTLKGMLWYQDQIKEGPVLSNLKDLIASMRVDFGLLNLPVVVGGMVNPEGPVVAMDSVNQALVADVHAVGYARLDVGKGKTPQADRLVMERLGQRYAEELLKVQAQCEARRQSRKPSGVPFVDAHIHASHTAVNGLDIVGKWMDENHVVRCVSKPLEPTRDKNEAQRKTMLANFQKYKGKIERFCVIFPEEVNTVDEAVKILKQEKADGAIGFGEHYGVSRMFDDPANLRLYAACEQVGLPVHFHIDSNKNMDERGLPRLERVLKMFPKCILIAHAEFWLELSNGTCDRLLQTYPNLYAEPSGHRMALELNRDRTYTKKFLERNADKILFGTDEGWWSFGKDARAIQFELFEDLDMSDEVRAKIYHKNAERVFGFGQ
jgi:uncharacterized protein